MRCCACPKFVTFLGKELCGNSEIGLRACVVTSIRVHKATIAERLGTKAVEAQRVEFLHRSIKRCNRVEHSASALQDKGSLHGRLCRLDSPEIGIREVEFG